MGKNIFDLSSSPSAAGFGCKPVIEKCRLCGTEFWSRPEVNVCPPCHKKAVDRMYEAWVKLRKKKG